MPGSPSTPARRSPPRRIPVLVGTLPIEDDQTPPPVVGALGRYPLVFAEATDTGPDATAATFLVHATPTGNGAPLDPGLRWDGIPDEGPPLWNIALHGDGWSASWLAPRPVTGQVELRGTLIGDLALSTRHWVHGLVTRAWVVTETFDTRSPDPQDWERVPGQQQLREITTAPHRFDQSMIVRRDPTTGRLHLVPSDPYSPEVGVLIQLDLDTPSTP